MNAEMLMKLSLIVSKMEIADTLAKLETNSKEELGKALIALVISNMYKADAEIYELIADYKHITIEEAKQVNIIPIIKDISNSELIMPFLQKS